MENDDVKLLSAYVKEYSAYLDGKIDKTHKLINDCIIPYEELTEEQKAKIGQFNEESAVFIGGVCKEGMEEQYLRLKLARDLLLDARWEFLGIKNLSGRLDDGK